MTTPKLEILSVTKKERSGRPDYFSVTARRGTYVHSVGLSEQNDVALEYLADRLEDGQAVPLPMAEFIYSLGMPTPDEYAQTYSAAHPLERAGMITPETQERMYGKVLEGLVSEGVDFVDEKTPLPALFGEYQSEDDRQRVASGDEISAIGNVPRASQIDFGDF